MELGQSQSVARVTEGNPGSPELTSNGFNSKITLGPTLFKYILSFLSGVEAAKAASIDRYFNHYIKFLFTTPIFVHNEIRPFVPYQEAHRDFYYKRWVKPILQGLHREQKEEKFSQDVLGGLAALAQSGAIRAFEIIFQCYQGQLAKILPLEQKEQKEHPLELRTIWYGAILSGCKEIVELFLTNKVDFTVYIRDKFSALHCAVANGNEGIVELLITPERANRQIVIDGRPSRYIDLQTNKKLTALQMAIQNQHAGITKKLRDAGADENHADFHQLNTSIQRCIFAQGSWVDKMVIFEQFFPLSPSVLAITETSDLELMKCALTMRAPRGIIQKLYYTEGVKLNFDKGVTLWHVTARANYPSPEEHVEVLNFLYETKGELFDKVSDLQENDTPFVRAIQAKNATAVQFLLEKYLIKACVTNKISVSFLMGLSLLAVNGDTNAFNFIFKHLQQKPHLIQEIINEVWFYAIQKGHRDLVILLLDHNEQCWQPDRSNQSTAIHHAAYMGHIPLLRLFIERGIMEEKRSTTKDTTRLVDRVNSLGNSPLYLAIHRGYSEAAEVLVLEAKATIDPFLLHRVIREDKVSLRVLELLVRHQSSLIDGLDQQGRSPLHVAVQTLNKMVVQFLLAKNANALLLIPPSNEDALSIALTLETKTEEKQVIKNTVIELLLGYVHKIALDPQHKQQQLAQRSWINATGLAAKQLEALIKMEHSIEHSIETLKVLTSLFPHFNKELRKGILHKFCMDMMKDRYFYFKEEQQAKITSIINALVTPGMECQLKIYKETRILHYCLYKNAHTLVHALLKGLGAHYTSEIDDFLRHELSQKLNEVRPGYYEKELKECVELLLQAITPSEKLIKILTPYSHISYVSTHLQKIKVQLTFKKQLITAELLAAETQRIKIDQREGLVKTTNVQEGIMLAEIKCESKESPQQLSPVGTALLNFWNYIASKQTDSDISCERLAKRNVIFSLLMTYANTPQGRDPKTAVDIIDIIDLGIELTTELFHSCTCASLLKELLVTPYFQLRQERIDYLQQGIREFQTTLKNKPLQLAEYHRIGSLYPKFPVLTAPVKKEAKEDALHAAPVDLGLIPSTRVAQPTTTPIPVTVASLSLS